MKYTDPYGTMFWDGDPGGGKAIRNYIPWKAVAYAEQQDEETYKLPKSGPGDEYSWGDYGPGLLCTIFTSNSITIVGGYIPLLDSHMFDFYYSYDEYDRYPYINVQDNIDYMRRQPNVHVSAPEKIRNIDVSSYRIGDVLMINEGNGFVHAMLVSNIADEKVFVLDMSSPNPSFPDSKEITDAKYAEYFLIIIHINQFRYIP